MMQGKTLFLTLLTCWFSQTKSTLSLRTSKQYPDDSSFGKLTWQQIVAQSRIVKMETGCGRMQNRLVTFSDGSKACARYRQNTSLMQGELYSYYVAKLLGMSENLPDVTVALPDVRSEQWNRVAQDVLNAGWPSDKLVILTKYMPHLKDSFLPSPLKSMSSGSLLARHITKDNANILSQWSDMIIFDYIIANTDRLVNSLHNKQWNKDIMNSPVHNLAQTRNQLIFFDNEDGLFHGYRILPRYSHLHEQSLKAICVFNEQTIKRLQEVLTNGESIRDRLVKLMKENEPIILNYLPKVSEKTMHTLTERMTHVLEHVKSCQNQNQDL